MFLSEDILAVQKLYPWCSDTAVKLIGKEVLKGKRVVAFPSAKRKDLILWTCSPNEQTPIDTIINDFAALEKNFRETYMDSPMASMLRASMPLDKLRAFFFYGALTAVLTEAESLFRKPARKTSSKLIPIRLVRPPAIHAILNDRMGDKSFNSNVALIDVDASGMSKGAATFKWIVNKHTDGVVTYDIGT